MPTHKDLDLSKGEPTRGGGSKPVSWWQLLLAFLAALCVMAYLAGGELRREHTLHRVPNSEADQTLCTNSPNGPVAYVDQYDDDQMLNVHCKNGIVMYQAAPTK